MSSDRLTTEDKALKINLKEDIYGCFAEIGAGQEVAANFFKAGGSSGTIAFTRSAYDMKVSDVMYGPTPRYVCEERLTTMLSAEYEQLKDVLPEKNKESRFFAFCNTVESLNYHKTNQGALLDRDSFSTNIRRKAKRYCATRETSRFWA